MTDRPFGRPAGPADAGGSGGTAAGSPATRAGADRSVRPDNLSPPVLPRDTVRRRRLLARLDAEAAAPLTRVRAAAGFGKTTLLANWVAAAPRPAAWVSLDAGDDDPFAFAARIVAALDRVRSGLLDSVRPL